jgi:uncharacterized protein involved in exopolysaccharide biosynthesis
MAYDIFYAERESAEVKPKEAAVEVLSKRVEEGSKRLAEVRRSLGITEDAPTPGGSELESAVFAQRDLEDRFQQAQLDLDQARSELPFRYALLEAPRVPSEPASTNLPQYAALVFVTIVMVLGACLLMDAIRGRIVEPWQAEKLNLRVLAVARRPKTS